MAEPSSKLVFRWDLDKTYLHTDFDSVAGLVKTAFESAGRKKTVPGAGALVKELQHDADTRTMILSGSPEQMRPVLETKLRLDGIRWDEFVLKPSLQHLLKGRLRSLKNQLAYKLGALLESRTRLDASYDEILFGDDSEADAYIYCLYADVLAERVSLDMLLRVLEAGRLYPHEIFQVMRLASGLRKRDCVRQVFIHLDRVSDPEIYARLGNRVVPIYNYFQAALVLFQEGRLSSTALLGIAREIATEPGFGLDILAASFEDLLRRNRLSRSRFPQMRLAGPRATIQDQGNLSTAWQRLVASIQQATDDRKQWSMPPEPDVIDYVALLHIDREHHRESKRRVRWRRGIL